MSTTSMSSSATPSEAILAPPPREEDATTTILEPEALTADTEQVRVELVEQDVSQTALKVSSVSTFQVNFSENATNPDNLKNLTFSIRYQGEFVSVPENEFNELKNMAKAQLESTYTQIIYKLEQGANGRERNNLLKQKAAFEAMTSYRFLNVDGSSKVKLSYVDANGAAKNVVIDVNSQNNIEELQKALIKEYLKEHQDLDQEAENYHVEFKIYNDTPTPYIVYNSRVDDEGDEDDTEITMEPAIITKYAKLVPSSRSDSGGEKIDDFYEKTMEIFQRSMEDKRESRARKKYLETLQKIPEHAKHIKISSQ